ncbi:MAG: hypothetical protein ABF289_09905 [Clostridiales bacterium]
MSKFCVNCGRPLKDNQACNCSLTKINYEDEFKEDSMVNIDEDNPYYTTKYSNKKYNALTKLGFFVKMFNVAVKYLKNPLETISEYSYSKSLSTPIFFFTFHALITSLFTTLSLYNILTYNLDKLFLATRKEVATTTYDHVKLSLSNYTHTFFYTIVIFIIQTISIYFLIKIFVKKKEQFNYLFTAISLNSIPIIIGTTICFFLFNTSNIYLQFIGIFLIFFSVILASILSFNVLKDNLKISPDFSLYFITFLVSIYYFSLLTLALKLF